MDLYKNGRNSFICNSPKLETMQMSLNRRINKLWDSTQLEKRKQTIDKMQ